MYSSFQPKPVKKRKPKAGLSRSAAPVGESASSSYTSTNKTSNARAGQQYRTVAGTGGTYHVYASGERVFVKSKKKNPSRSYT